MPQQFHLDINKLNQSYLQKLNESDIIITNPPFSLKYQYIQHLVTFKKPFLLILPSTCVQCCKFFQSFQTQENINKIGLLISITRIPFLIKSNDKNKSTKIKKFDSQYSRVRPNFETLIVSWNIPEFADKIKFLDTTEKELDNFNLRFVESVL